MFESLKKAPFNLDDTALAWVRQQYDSMDLQQRLGQLFNLLVMDESDEQLAVIRHLQPGGITRSVGRELQPEINYMQELLAAFDCPPLVSADVEGGQMSFAFGSSIPNQLALAALNDTEVTGRCASIQARESRALGINWTFTPVVDLNRNFRSAIVGTRSYGSDQQTVIQMGRANIRGFQHNGMAATAKHWPGDGYDDRDQHLVTSVNPLIVEDWHQQFGTLYRSMIEEGVMSIMSAHIALPEYMKLHTDDPEQWWRPASINRLLNQQLLREELGFNGLIVSDASVMAGLSGWADRATIIAELIENGCDMVLFCREPVEDMAYLMAAVRRGDVSEQRIQEAVLRVLGMKAALGLHRTPPKTDITVFAQKADMSGVYARCPTLVKDRTEFLPVSAERHPRVLVFSPGIQHVMLEQPIPLQLPDQLREEGFEVTLFTPGMDVQTRDYDWVLYLLAEESSLLRSHIYIDWFRLHGGFMPAMTRYWVDIPTVMVSFGHPYFLYDAPRIPTYINAYCATAEMQVAVLSGLLGRESFNRFNPVDPFCGSEQGRY
ncbi:glycoside hydrolase family 3 protein [Gynuella sunshinyii]|uniref:beta-N-acetylhexosaminidase n=1 Tax=Gynuella sunshinyii YC6258 TaxID=1445510 RepID=A0A0C5VUE8_9GAMM|nr:glycoside hydrolase family 3 N-terminal domain-containing protein [Gynuella sunshinyii]AJQ96943.1 beta-glucosidase-related glycosidase [Gynuella sunshinyii YC6258]